MYMYMIATYFISSCTNVYSDVAPGGWSGDGLSVETINNQTITCSSTHLTSFAVLVDVSGGSQVVII